MWDYACVSGGRSSCIVREFDVNTTNVDVSFILINIYNVDYYKIARKKVRKNIIS